MAFTARVKALAEVCGMDLRIASHRRKCEQAAGQLAHYSAGTIRQRFGPLAEKGSAPAGGRSGTWQWYVDDWRGARKGEQPRPRDVVANISRQRVDARPEGGATAGGVGAGAGPELNQGPAQIAFQEFMRQEAARQAAGNGGYHAANGG